MTQTGEHGRKVCHLCGLDVSSRARVKDDRGRYYCRPCAQYAKTAVRPHLGLGDSGPQDEVRPDSRAPRTAVGPREATFRMVCLASLIRRWRPEMVAAEAGAALANDAPSLHGSLTKLVNALNTWAQRDGVWDALSPVELRLMRKGVGAWTPQDLASVQRRVEALSTLQWALQLQEASAAFDEPADVDALLAEAPADESLTPKAGTQLAPILDSAQLRGPGVIRRATETSALWHWRARVERALRHPERHRLPPGVSRDDVRHLIERAASKAASDHLFTPLKDDFPAFGRPFAKLSDREFATVRYIASERLHALRWLTGQIIHWDDDPAL